MAKVEIELSEALVERARAMAEGRHESLEQWIAGLVEEKTGPELPGRSIIGMFADASDELDEIVAEAMRNRSLRVPRTFEDTNE